jgi:hypothetical protein
MRYFLVILYETLFFLQTSEMTSPKKRHLADREWVGGATPFLILFLICSVMIFPGEEKKSKLVVKQLMPETQKEEKPKTDPTGERDPFLNLLINAQKKVDKLENWPIDDVKLEGIIKMKDGHFRALLVSPKGKAFFASVGQKLHDGEIDEITFEKVVFKKRVAPAPHSRSVR